MGLNILCSGHLVRYPLGGHSWHHLQYLVGFRRLGHSVTFVEHYGWPDSCYDPVRSEMTADPSYGVAYLRMLLEPHELQRDWCFLAEDGRAHGLSREELGERCREADVYFNLSNINRIPETDHCRRRVLVDTDPVFTQIGAFGMGGPFSSYERLFTYGENIQRPGCSMPDGDARWLPTRQPVVLDLWPVTSGPAAGPFTTVMNWSNFGDRTWQGRVFGQKDREFEPFFDLPNRTQETMEIAVGAPGGVRRRLETGGWRIADPREISLDPSTYQDYLRASAAEFCVAKHAYVSTNSGWFSDRTSAYLASGRPAVVQDTGFRRHLPCGEGLLAYRTPEEAEQALRAVREDYESHCAAARKVVEEHFDARKVLTALLEASL
jgi:hypothetical protein